MEASLGEGVILQTSHATGRVAWTEHVAEAGAKILRTKADPDSAPVMRGKREEVAANGYEGFLLQ